MMSGFILAHSVYGIDYKELLTAFVTEEKTKTGAFSDLIKVFYDQARNMQNGGPEFMSSKRWLNIWWPPDELAFIKAVTEDKLDDFYDDAKGILYGVFDQRGIKNYEGVISESIFLNKSLIKLPNQMRDLEIKLNWNILDIYNADWCEKVVWWSNKKGAYLYDCLVTENKRKRKLKIPQVIRIESEPFGNDARYQ